MSPTGTFMRSIGNGFRSGTVAQASKRTQWLIVAIAWVAVLGVLVVVRLATAPVEAAPSQSTAPHSDASFRPSPAQWGELGFATVTTTPFRTEHVTDGKIALAADRTTPVFSPYSGRVLRVLVNVGDYVREGQPLFEIDASEVVQGRGDLVAAANALDTARAQVRLAQTNEERKRALLDAQAASLQDLQQSELELVSAKNALRSAETALVTARHRLQVLGKSGAEIDAMLSARNAAPVSVVRAPIAGTVTDRQLGPGQFLVAGATNPVFALGDLSTVWLIANVRETEAPAIRIGQSVEVRVLAVKDRVFRARVTSVAPGVDPNTRRVAVRAEVPNSDRVLKPEMFATFSIVTGSDDGALGIPAIAMIRDGDMAHVWVRRGDALEARGIQPGRSEHGMVEVKSGLAAGEKVVTNGALFLDRAARRG
jgi:cobalt-zinc-cadmium efflux system membrane fusion protein